MCYTRHSIATHRDVIVTLLCCINCHTGHCVVLESYALGGRAFCFIALSIGELDAVQRRVVCTDGTLSIAPQNRYI